MVNVPLEPGAPVPAAKSRAHSAVARKGFTMSRKTASGTLSSAVANAGTFTVSYPSRAAPELGVTDAGDFFQAFFHELIVNGSKYVYPDDFQLSFGASSVTVTNAAGVTWPTGSAWTIQFDEPGKRVFAADRNDKSQIVARTARADTVLVSLGAPDILDADGICVSQSIAAGTFSTATSATLDGALASTNAATGAVEVVLDVPRNVVAAWTTTAVLCIEGKDEYGNTVVEKSASGTSHTGKKAFKKITRVWSSVAITSASVGTGDVLGLPFFLPGRQHVRAEIIDGNLCGDKEHVYLPFSINVTDLGAGTDQQMVAPCAGRIVRVSTILQTALGDSLDDIGTVNLKVNGTAVSESTLTSYATSGAAGSVASAVISTASTNAAIAAGDAIAVSPTSTWASVGSMNGIVEIAPTGAGIYKSGTFVAGLTATDASTATSADVRGTYAPPVAMSGSIVVQLLVSALDLGNRGAPQFTL